MTRSRGLSVALGGAFALGMLFSALFMALISSNRCDEGCDAESADWRDHVDAGQ
ncbi:MAG TPA: hypothetical protein VF533_11805 [Solirubrobacteraceae bacterium]|jgi:hypothetical protein